MEGRVIVEVRHMCRVVLVSLTGNIYPKYSAYFGKLCTSNVDCQSLDRITDTSAICSPTLKMCIVAGVCVRVCVLNLNPRFGGNCHGYNILLYIGCRLWLGRMFHRR